MLMDHPFSQSLSNIFLEKFHIQVNKNNKSLNASVKCELFFYLIKCTCKLLKIVSCKKFKTKFKTKLKENKSSHSSM